MKAGHVERNCREFEHVIGNSMFIFRNSYCKLTIFHSPYYSLQHVQILNVTSQRMMLS